MLYTAFIFIVIALPFCAAYFIHREGGWPAVLKNKFAIAVFVFFGAVAFYTEFFAERRPPTKIYHADGSTEWCDNWSGRCDRFDSAGESSGYYCRQIPNPTRPCK